MATFDQCFDRLMGHEGGYVNDPRDPGGETKWGVSKRSYPGLDIANLTKEHAKDIFKRDFWDKVGGDSLWDGVAFQLADFAYHSGPTRALAFFQDHCSQDQSESDQIMSLCAERLYWLTTLPTWKTYGKGWARRIADNLRFGVEDSE